MAMVMTKKPRISRTKAGAKGRRIQEMAKHVAPTMMQ